MNDHISDTGMQARFLYHEAATIEAVDPSALFSGRRLQLLREALENAEKASDICPSSLSCAALRATLVLNVLVENSVLAPGGLGGTRAEVLNGQQGEALKKQFKAAVDTCSRVLTMPQPVVDEPVIAITTGNQKTFDPCSLVCITMQQKHSHAFITFLQLLANGQLLG